MNFHAVDLTQNPPALVGSPLVEPPSEFRGLSVASLQNLSWIGAPLEAVWGTRGIWPIVATDPAIADPDVDEVSTGTLASVGIPNAVTKTVPAIYATQTKPVPAFIDARQFFQALALRGFITQNDALAVFRTGTLPASLQGAIDGIANVTTRFNAQIFYSGGGLFPRNHQFIEAYRNHNGWSVTNFNNAWRFAASL